jgi:hypothetical protein
VRVAVPFIILESISVQFAHLSSQTYQVETIRYLSPWDLGADKALQIRRVNYRSGAAGRRVWHPCKVYRSLR